MRVKLYYFDKITARDIISNCFSWDEINSTNKELMDEKLNENFCEVLSLDVTNWPTEVNHRVALLMINRYGP